MNVPPPNNIDAEKRVLGSVLMDSTCLAIVRDRLSPDDFYHAAHRTIYAAMLDCADMGYTIDDNGIVQRLGELNKLNEVGGLAGVWSVVSAVPNSLLVDEYANMVRQMAWRRQALLYLQEMARLVRSGETPIREIHHRMIEGMNKLGGSALRGSRTMRDLMSELLDDIDASLRNEHPARGWTTGFEMLDRLFDGVYGPGQFTVLGGYTNQGKTQIAVQMALAAARQGPVLYVTLESDPEMIVQRQVAAVSGIPLTRIIRRDLTSDDHTRVIQTAGALAELPIETTTVETLRDIEAYVADMAVRYDFREGMIFIDDVDSLAEGMRGANDYERQKRAAVGLLRLTLRTGWGVVALKQLLLPTEAKGVTNSERLLSILTPGIMSFEGGRTIAQKGGNIITMLSPEWIRAKVYEHFLLPGLLPDRCATFRKLKARDARSNGPIEVSIPFNPDIPRFENAVRTHVDLDNIPDDLPGIPTSTPIAFRTNGNGHGRKVHGQNDDID